MNSWFEVKMKYTKQLDDGRLKRVTEPYLIDATSFTEAEARAYEEVGEFVKGEFIITAITRKEYADIFHYEDEEDWYESKLTYISVDEDSGKEKKTTNNFLVTACSVKQAYDRINESLSDMTVDYEITSTSLTKLVEVIPYKPNLDVEISRQPVESMQ